MTNWATSENIRPMTFDPEQLGRSLREVAVDVVEAEGATLLTRWFHSNDDVDLTIWVDETRQVIRHQVNFYGQVVEWNIFDGIRTGAIVEEEGQGLPDGEVSELIQFDAHPQSAAVQQALRLIEHAAALADDDRLTMCHNLVHHPTGSGHGDESFLGHYREAHSKENGRRPSFWKRLRKWVTGNNG